MAPQIFHCKVREYCGTYIANCNGKRASCTASAEYAARSAAAKAFEIALDVQRLPCVKTGIEIEDWKSEVKRIDACLFEVTFSQKS